MKLYIKLLIIDKVHREAGKFTDPENRFSKEARMTSVVRKAKFTSDCHGISRVNETLRRD